MYSHKDDPNYFASVENDFNLMAAADLQSKECISSDSTLLPGAAVEPASVNSTIEDSDYISRKPQQEDINKAVSMETDSNVTKSKTKGKQLLLRRHHSTSGIETNVRNSPQMTLKSDTATTNVQTTAISKASVDLIPPNYCIKSDLDQIAQQAPVILDSHTCYRQIIDDEITLLKFQLTKTKALADSLDHELNMKKTSYDLLNEQLCLVTRQRRDSNKKVNQLETVLTHLQDNVRESAMQRVELASKQVHLNESCLFYQHSSKKHRNECKRLRQDLVDIHQDIAGKHMENQGLRSENDWLKNQLWPGKAGGEDSDSETNKKDFKITGIRQFLSPLSPPKYQRRRRKRVNSKAADVAAGTNVTKTDEQGQAAQTTEGGDIAPLNTDGEDQTAGYTSLTDFQLRSATESGIDIGNVITKDKNHHSSFIRKLALRHGVSATANAEDGNSANSYRSTGDSSSILEETKAVESSARRHMGHSHSSSSFKSIALDNSSRQVSFKSSLSKISLHETDQENEEEKEAMPWSLWGIITGASPKPIDQGEDKTKELSDSSHSSAEFIQHAQRASRQIRNQLETKPSSVLVPKRLSGA